MKEVSIKDICKKDSSALKQKELLSIGEYPVYGASGIAGYLNKYQQDNAYIGIVKDGSGIGRVNFYPEKTSLIGTMQYILPKEGFNIKYVCYCLQSLDLSKYKQGAAIPHIYFKDYGERIVKVTDDVEEQERIVSRLDAAFVHIDELKANAEKQLNDARTLFQKSLAKAMEPKEGWEEKVLGEMGDFKNGMNFAHNEAGYDIRILGVGDFGDKFSISNPKELSMISLNQMPSDDYLLKDEDVVFVRSNGNKQLVGRSVLIITNGTPVTFSGFCIRYRKSYDNLNIRYLVYYLKTKETREKLFGNGANISNLNQKILQVLRISLPPFSEQQSIVERLDALSAHVRELDENQKKIISECDALKQALLRKVFE